MRCSSGGRRSQADARRRLRSLARASAASRRRQPPGSAARGRDPARFPTHIEARGRGPARPLERWKRGHRAGAPEASPGPGRLPAEWWRQSPDRGSRRRRPGPPRRRAEFPARGRLRRPPPARRGSARRERLSRQCGTTRRRSRTRRRRPAAWRRARPGSAAWRMRRTAWFNWSANSPLSFSRATAKRLSTSSDNCERWFSRIWRTGDVDGPEGMAGFILARRSGGPATDKDLYEPHPKAALAVGAIVLQQERSGHVHRSKLACGQDQHQLVSTAGESARTGN